MDLNDIPKNKTKGFPMGVSEHIWATAAEMTAFITGVDLAEDIDVECGEPFERKGKQVVRVKIGDWGDDDDEDLDIDDLDDEEVDDDDLDTLTQLYGK